jgi:hypothetical protein
MTTFNPQEISECTVTRELTDMEDYLVFENSDRELASNDVLLHIKQAEEEGKVAVFHNITFTDINITNEDFLVPIIFSHCRFNGNLKLTSNHFFYQIVFFSVEFFKVAKFKLSCFFNGGSFINCNFYDETSFERVKFLVSSVKYVKKEAFNIEIKFAEIFQYRNTVDFLGVIFHKNVTFINSNFGCSVLFSYYKKKITVFKWMVDFSCIVEEKENLNIGVYFKIEQQTPKIIELAMDTFHRISFIGVRFYDEATFENRIFQKKTIFKDNIFYRAPKFHNCDLHHDTDFKGSDFKDTYTEGAERAYRSLKLMMDKKRARREEGMFFALEQKSMLNTPIMKSRFPPINFIRNKINKFIIWCVSTQEAKKFVHDSSTFNPEVNDEHSGFYVSLTEKIISLMYLILSNYGQSIKRPAIILILSMFVVFPSIYYTCFDHTRVIAGNIGAAYQMSFQQLFRPFEIYTVKFSTHYDDTTFALYLVATVQSLLNLGLVALSLLAVRGRFRMY